VLFQQRCPFHITEAWIMSAPHWLARILDHYQVPYQYHEHPPVYSAAHLAHAEHVPGGQVAKPVFLVAGKLLITVVLPANARVDLPRVQQVVGAADLQLASEAEITARFKGCQPGAVPPLRLRGDQIILMDRSLAHFSTMTFAAGTNDGAVCVRFRDWYRMVRPGVGRFAESTEQNGKAQTAATVLVVEDEHDTNDLLCRLLEREGFACRAAEDGGRALAMARELRPAAILLDLMLPDMSGYDMVERLRQTGPLKAPPVVVVTALDDDAARQRGQQLGAEAYFTKPFKPDVLLRELQGILADARA
jgi:CheY-like chemotaxis protein/prolyl-tRNA editing enzyme YbaK/EbsC (Cys-tRNA(Pro) deacylase)